MLCARAHIAGIDAVFRQRARAFREFCEKQVPVVVEVADDGHGSLSVLHSFHNFRDSLCRFRSIDRDAHQFGSGGRQRDDLACRGFDIFRIRVGHRLHDDGSAASHHHAADIHSNRFPSRLNHFAFTVQG